LSRSGVVKRKGVVIVCCISSLALIVVISIYSLTLPKMIESDVNSSEDYYKNHHTNCTSIQNIRNGSETARGNKNGGELDPFVFTYSLPARFNLALRNCNESMFATEVLMHDYFSRSYQFRTQDPSEANLFFVPIYSTCYRRQKSVMDSNFKEELVIHFVMEVIEFIRNSFPFWNRTNGKDHIFVFPHDYGKCLTYFPERAYNPNRARKKLLKVLREAVVLSPFNNETSPCYHIHDVVVPPYVPIKGNVSEKEIKKYVNFSSLKETKQNLSSWIMSTSPIVSPSTSSASPLSLSIEEKKHREYLGKRKFAFFAGTINWNTGPGKNHPDYSRGIRQSLFRLYENDDIIEVNSGSYSELDYFQAMKESLFCLAPPGWTSWTTRIVESVSAGCIPVIIQNAGMLLPFQHHLDYDSFSLRIDEEDTLHLKEILLAMNVSRIAKLQSQVLLMTKHFRYDNQGEVYQFIMQEIKAKTDPSHTRLNIPENC